MVKNAYKIKRLVREAVQRQLMKDNAFEEVQENINKKNICQCTQEFVNNGIRSNEANKVNIRE